MTLRFANCKHCCHDKPSAAFDRWVGRGPVPTVHRSPRPAEALVERPDGGTRQDTGAPRRQSRELSGGA